MRRSSARVARSAAIAAALLASTAGARADAQGQSSDPGAVTLVAHVPARITIHELTTPTVSSDTGLTVVTRRLHASANVPFAVVAHRPAAAGATGATLEVRDRSGAWVRLAPGDGATVLEARALDVTTHPVECRVVGAPADDVDCPLVLELISADPAFPLRVTADAPVSAPPSGW